MELTTLEAMWVRIKTVVKSTVKSLFWGSLIGFGLFAAAPVLLGAAGLGTAALSIPGSGLLGMLGILTPGGRGVAGDLIGGAAKTVGPMALSAGGTGALLVGGVFTAFSFLKSLLWDGGTAVQDAAEEKAANAELDQRGRARSRNSVTLQSQGRGEAGQGYIPDSQGYGRGRGEGRAPGYG